MILHNDIWGDTSITIVEEINGQFLIVEELNMLALYSRLGKKQSKILQEALISFYEILFSSKNKSRVNDTVPFTPDISFDDNGNGYLCLVKPTQENNVTDLKAIAQKISEVDTIVAALPASREAVVGYELVQLITHGGKGKP